MIGPDRRKANGLKVDEESRKMEQLDFKILLEASLPTPKELQLSAQVLAMYGLFAEGRFVSSIELGRIGREYGVKRFLAVRGLWELRRALVPSGFSIDLITKRDRVSFYKLVRIEESSFYREHQATL